MVQLVEHMTRDLWSYNLSHIITFGAMTRMTWAITLVIKPGLISHYISYPITFGAVTKPLELTD